MKDFTTLFFTTPITRIIHSIKTALAVLIGYIITKIFHFQIDQWLLITIIVVMCAQINVGGMLQKSYMRFLGTLSGSIIAAFTLTFSAQNVFITGMVITGAALFFSYIATGEKSYSDAGTLGAATLIIILINKDPNLLLAAERCAEITLGIVIAALVSQFILPIHARALLRHSEAQSLRHLREFYIATLLSKEQKNEDYYKDFDDMIVKSYVAQRKLAPDAAREFIGTAFNKKKFGESLWCYREALRAISFMHNALLSSEKNRELFCSQTINEDFHKKVCDVLSQLAEKADKKSFVITATLPSSDSLKAVLANANALHPNDKLYLDGFLFCAEILLARLRTLIALL